MTKVLGRPQHSVTAGSRPGYETLALASCVTYLGFSFADAGWHPLCAAAEDFVTTGNPSYQTSRMAAFYAGSQPETVADAHLLDAGEAPHCAGISARAAIHVYPWSAGSRRLSKGECQHFGPAPHVGPRHFARQGRLVRSVRARGYEARRLFSGAVKGIWLVSGEARRFLLLGGQHRAGVLAALGSAAISARVDGYVDLADVADWPRVRTGTMIRDEALSVALQYFRLSGRERAPDQRSWGVPSSQGQSAPSLAS